MTFISLNKDSLQTFISGLNSYADSVDNERGQVYIKLWINSYPTEISDMVNGGD